MTEPFNGISLNLSIKIPESALCINETNWWNQLFYTIYPVFFKLSTSVILDEWVQWQDNLEFKWGQKHSGSNGDMATYCTLWIEPAWRNCKHGVRSRLEVKRTWQHTMTVDNSEKVDDQIGQPAIQARSEAYLDNLAQMCITNHRVAWVELPLLTTCHMGTLLDLDLWVA